MREDEPGFTLWPALSAGTQFDGAQGGTNYFVSSNAVFNDLEGDSSEIVVWALSNTNSLNSSNPNPRLTKTRVPSLRYAIPANSEQKTGPYPLGECLNDTVLSVAGVYNCGDDPSSACHRKTCPSARSIRATRGSWTPAMPTASCGRCSGPRRTWPERNAPASPGSCSTLRSTARVYQLSMRKQGILALEDESLAYPTIGVTKSGRGVIGFTRVGETLFPSVGYASIDDVAGVGEVHMIKEGRSPQDGFTEYPPIGGNRPRWGDYGAAAVDDNTVYLAGQYIEQPPCTLDDFIATGFLFRIAHVARELEHSCHATAAVRAWRGMPQSARSGRRQS